MVTIMSFFHTQWSQIALNPALLYHTRAFAILRLFEPGMEVTMSSQF